MEAKQRVKHRVKITYTREIVALVDRAGDGMMAAWEIAEAGARQGESIENIEFVGVEVLP